MKELVNLEENFSGQERNMEPINVVKAQCNQIENNRVKIEEDLNLIDDYPLNLIIIRARIILIHNGPGIKLTQFPFV